MTLTQRLSRAARIAAALCALALLALYVLALFETDSDAALFAQIEQSDDPSRAKGLSDMLQTRFVPSTEVHKGERDFAAHWFRVTLAPRNDRKDTILHVWPPTLDSVTLYIPLGPQGGWRELHNGDQVGFLQRNYRAAGIGFRLPATALGQPLYLRVVNKTSNNLILSADTADRSERKFYRQMALHIPFFGLLGAGLMLSVLRWVERPTALSMSLFGFMSTYLVYAASALGYGAVLYSEILPGLDDAISNLSSVLIVLFSMLFQRFYLSLHGPDDRVLWLTDLVIAGQFLALVPQFLGEYHLVWEVSLVLSLAFIVLLVPLVATARIRSRSIAFTLYFAYAVYLAVSSLRILALAGVISSNAATRHFIEIFGLNTLFLAIVLIALDRRQRSEQDREVRLSLATTRAAQAAHARNAEIQQNFISVMVHEVRNKLTVLQLSLPNVTDDDNRARIAGAIGGVNGALAKAQQAIWLSRGTWPVRPVRLAVLDALDRVIDRLAAADRVLPHGDAASPEVTADAGMLDALLAEALHALLEQCEPDGTVTIDISQPTPAAPCVLDLLVTRPRNDRSGRDPDLDHASRIAAAMGASLRLSRPSPNGLQLLLVFPV